MKSKRRWMQWVLEESAKDTTPMPWSRSARQKRGLTAPAPTPKLRIAQG